MKPGDEFELRVTPDRYVTVRYAGPRATSTRSTSTRTSRARSAFPGRILHGLWTMAQVARAHTEALGGPDRLARLSVQFRGMGALEQEITVHGTVDEIEGGHAVVSSEATQDGKRIIRNGRAEIRLP